MRLKALDQLHVSSVQPDSLRPGQEFDVSDAVGEDLLKVHPTKVTKVGDSEPQKADSQAKAELAPLSAKAEPAPKNKAEPAPPNKAETQPRKKRGK